MNIRPAAVAGYFYPADAVELQTELGALIPPASATVSAPAPLRALIVPHAGYRYSGVIAGAAYACLSAGAFQRVLLLGPAHRVALRGIAIPSVAAFDTPLGAIALDRAGLDSLRALPFVQQRDDAHAKEHALEVQLPFLQRQLGAFTLLPLVVGDCEPEQVAMVIEQFADAKTLIVISTDLSHFHSDAEARVLDAETIAHIENAEPMLEPEQACGAMPLNGFLYFLNQHSHGDGARGKPQLLRAGNSAEYGGPADRVVGYASFCVH
ncbi:AmmeMemoRadiSam system protein B [Permianibacter sp. IMCC34836]|uniref:AmmeMemoRadiSam system protein B n=1 Tax=Permianibacter fluminis TaxID=2738515 RepID=UPI00155380A3|nr:AmmeMemoRadiSam system protein B [Permianibacter fluminis]NQD35490.1 AmmeMemoRadiSam system protein B [Permianibacter fluminis]